MERLYKIKQPRWTCVVFSVAAVKYRLITTLGEYRVERERSTPCDKPRGFTWWACLGEGPPLAFESLKEAKRFCERAFKRDLRKHLKFVFSVQPVKESP